MMTRFRNTLLAIVLLSAAAFGQIEFTAGVPEHDGTPLTGGGSTVVCSSGDGTDSLTATGRFATRCTLTAGVLTANKIVRIKAYGTYITDGDAAPTPRFDVQLCTVNGCGSGTVISVAPISSATVPTNSSGVWSVDVTCRIRTAGASGVTTCSGNKIHQSSSSNSVAQIMRVSASPTGTTIDTTVNQIIHVFQPQTLSGDSTDLEDLIVEVK